MHFCMGFGVAKVVVVVVVLPEQTPHGGRFSMIILSSLIDQTLRQATFEDERFRNSHP